jgi:hypothetical protein
MEESQLRHREFEMKATTYGGHYLKIAENFANILGMCIVLVDTKSEKRVKDMMYMFTLFNFLKRLHLTHSTLN